MISTHSPQPIAEVDEIVLKHRALNEIGSLFTKRFAASQGSREFNGFVLNAEECLERGLAWRKKIGRTIVWSLLSVLCLAVACLKWSQIDGSDLDSWSNFPGFLLALAMSLLLTLVAIICWRKWSPYPRPNKAVIQVAYAWNTYRRFILEEGVADGLAVQLRTKGPACHFYDTEEVRDLLGWVLKSLFDIQAWEVKIAEDDQDMAKKSAAKRIMTKIDKLGQALGFPKRDWSVINKK